MKKLLITDLDDTLYDWMGFFIPSFYAMVDQLSNITEIDKNILLKEFKEKHQLYGSVEYPFVTLKLPSIKQKYASLSEAEIKVVLGEAFHKFNSIRKQRLQLYSGVEETLKTISEKGITIIGYTESSQENGFYRLKKLSIDQYFKHVYASKGQFQSSFPLDEKIMTVQTKKPDKDVLLSICERESCHPEETIYIGDSLTKDVYMAKMAGITSVWANYPKEKNNYYSMLVDITSWTDDDFKREAKLKKQYVESGMQPDFTIDSFNQLIPILLDN